MNGFVTTGMTGKQWRNSYRWLGLIKEGKENISNTQTPLPAPTENGNVFFSQSKNK